MLEIIKQKIWDLLKEKEISLIMLYNKQGEILWHKGRAIKGKSIGDGAGFSKTYILHSLNSDTTLEEENIVLESSTGGISESACDLHLKSLIIQPLRNNIFLYIDSGIKKYFSDKDREVFKALGELLSEIIEHIDKRGSDIGGITGNSGAIQNIRNLVLKYSIEEESILLLGETGVGKSHIAELIHHYSGRKGKFFTVNTPGIPDNLFESEMFGHKKGAFTDAKADKKGFVDEAEAGTLFFDEISEVPLSFQAKLLRFIETKKYTVLGDTMEKEADVRIIAATNRDLPEAIREKQFREDLYFRLQVLEIYIPPLRERREDIKALVMEKRNLLKGKKTGEGFWQVLFDHEWPGNARELITILIRAGIHCGDSINGRDMEEIIRRSCYSRSEEPIVDKSDEIWESVKGGLNFWDCVWQPFINRDIDRNTIKKVLKMALEEGRYSFRNTVRILNLQDSDYHSFMALMHKYKIDPRVE